MMTLFPYRSWESSVQEKSTAEILIRGENIINNDNDHIMCIIKILYKRQELYSEGEDL